LSRIYCRLWISHCFYPKNIENTEVFSLLEPNRIELNMSLLNPNCILLPSMSNWFTSGMGTVRVRMGYSQLTIYPRQSKYLGIQPTIDYLKCLIELKLALIYQNYVYGIKALSIYEYKLIYKFNLNKNDTIYRRYKNFRMFLPKKHRNIEKDRINSVCFDLRGKL